MNITAIHLNLIVAIAISIGMAQQNVSAAKCPCDIYADGEGPGPWIQADFENGIFKGDMGGFGDNTDKYYFPKNKTINANFVTAILKGHSGGKNHCGKMTIAG